MYDRDLEEDVLADTSDNFAKLLQQLLQGERDQGNKVDDSLVEQDANAVYAVREIIIIVWRDDNHIRISICSGS